MTENNTTQYTPGGSPAGTYGAPQWNPPTTPPKKPNFFKRHWLILTVGVVALALGSGIGAGNAKTETVEVIKEVQVPGPERVVTKEVKVNVPTVPASCLEALTLNEEAFDIASESLGYVSKGQFAAANASTSRLNALAPKVNAAKAACRAAS
jgi:hypothetical protein